MGSSYRYYTAAGKFFCYARDVTVRCPNHVSITERGVWELEHAKLVEELAGLGLDAYRLMSRSHRSLHGGFEDRSRKGHCAACGTRLERVGYHTWIEDKIERVELNEMTRTLNTALGSTHMMVPGSHRYWPTKREAIAWAREESQIERVAAREEVG
jgi:hypothetical protein